MNEQSVGSNSIPKGPSELPEVYGRLRRAEACAEQLQMLIGQLSERLAPVTRAQSPEAGSALKSVGYSAPLAAQIDTLADRLASSISTAESVLSRLEI